MISLFTLNLWSYYDFEKRLRNIIEVIKNKNPDVVLLQETQINEAQSSFSQVEIIKNHLTEYKYSLHSTIYLKEFQRGKKLEKPIQHGMSILSKYPILNSFEYYVVKNDGENEPRSVLCFDIEINSKIYNFTNIHFANKEDWALNQLTDFLQFLKSRDEKRIMLGDFNLFDLSKYKKESSFLDGYSLSFDYKNYVSFPEKNWCLDYVLLPEEFKFISLEIIDQYLSDHKGIFTQVQ